MNKTPNQIEKESPMVTMKCAVGEKVYGIIPTTFRIAMNVKIVKIKGKNRLPSFPIDSRTVEKMKL
jgi:hypothetical protein